MCAAVRRQPVAQGGLFSTPKASFSKETQELLKGLQYMYSQKSTRTRYDECFIILTSYDEGIKTNKFSTTAIAGEDAK